MNYRIDDVISIDQNTTITSIMNDLRQGKYFRKGFLEISLYNKNRDTFLVENFYNGTRTREELTASTVRKIIKDIIG